MFLISTTVPGVRLHSMIAVLFPSLFSNKVNPVAGLLSIMRKKVLLLGPVTVQLVIVGLYAKWKVRRKSSDDDDPPPEDGRAPYMEGERVGYWLEEPELAHPACPYGFMLKL